MGSKVSYDSLYLFVSVVFYWNFSANQQYDTLLPIIPCRHKLKAGIAYSVRRFLSITKPQPNIPRKFFQVTRGAPHWKKTHTQNSVSKQQIFWTQKIIYMYISYWMVWHIIRPSIVRVSNVFSQALKVRGENARRKSEEKKCSAGLYVKPFNRILIIWQTFKLVSFHCI